MSDSLIPPLFDRLPQRPPSLRTSEPFAPTTGTFFPDRRPLVPQPKDELDRQFVQSFSLASRQDPRVQAEIRRIGVDLKEFGIPQNEVRNNIEQYRKVAERVRMDTEKLRLQSPETYRLMTDPFYAQVAWDLSEELGLFEGLWNDYKRGWMLNTLGKMASAISYRDLTAQEWENIAKYQKKLEDLGSADVAFLTSALTLTGQFTEGAISALPYAVGGAATGAAVGALGGPAVIGAAPAGFSLGLRAGYIANSYQVNSGLAAINMHDRGHDQRSIRGSAIATGIGNALLDYFGAKAVAGLANKTKVGELLRQATSRNPLDKVSIGDTFRQVAGDVGRAVGAETLTETGQTLNEMIFEEVSRNRGLELGPLIGDELPRVEPTSAELEQVQVERGSRLQELVYDEKGQKVSLLEFYGGVLGDLGDTALEVAQGMAVIGGVGGGVRAARIRSRERQIVGSTQEFLSKIAEAPATLAEREPEQFRRWMQEVVKDSGAQVVKIPLSQMREKLRLADIDMGEAREVLPEIATAEEQAKDFGDSVDVVIPMDRLKSEVVTRAGLFEAIKPALRLDDDPLSFEEFQQREEEVRQARREVRRAAEVTEEAEGFGDEMTADERDATQRVMDEHNKQAEEVRRVRRRMNEMVRNAGLSGAEATAATETAMGMLHAVHKDIDTDLDLPLDQWFDSIGFEITSVVNGQVQARYTEPVSTQEPVAADPVAADPVTMDLDTEVPGIRVSDELNPGQERAMTIGDIQTVEDADTITEQLSAVIDSDPPAEMTEQELIARQEQLQQALQSVSQRRQELEGIVPEERRVEQQTDVRDLEQTELTTLVPHNEQKAADMDPQDVKVPGLEQALQPGGEKALTKNVAAFDEKVVEGKVDKTTGEKKPDKRAYDSIAAEGDSAEERAESILNQMVENLLHIFDSIPEDVRERSRLWYVGANRIAREMADRYGISLSQVAGMLAVTSPQADWRMNVSYVERIADALTQRQDQEWTPEMEEWASGWINSATQKQARATEAKTRKARLQKAKKDAAKSERAFAAAQAKQEAQTEKRQAAVDAAEAKLAESRADVREAKKQLRAAIKAGDGKPVTAARKAVASAEKKEAKANEQAKKARADLRALASEVGKARTKLRKDRDAVTEKQDRVNEPDPNLTAYEAVRGKKLRELDDAFLQAWWIRSFDEAHNQRGFREVTPEGGMLEFATTGSGALESIGWKSFNAIAKAAELFQDDSVEALNRNLGGEHKVRNFYNNIFNPEDGRFVTSDTHQVAANLFLPLGADAIEVTHNFGGTGSSSVGGIGLNGTYWLYHEAVARAAAQRQHPDGVPVLPREMQSISWEAIRSLFSDSFKRDEKKVNQVRDLWVEYQNGTRSIEETWAAIEELAGGYSQPFWVGKRPADAMAFADGYSSYETDLPVGRQGDRSVRPGDGRDAGPDAADGAQRVLYSEELEPEPSGDGADRVRRGRFVRRQAGERITRTIELMKDANASTIYHELAHVFFDLRLDALDRQAANPEGPQSPVLQETMLAFFEAMGVGPEDGTLEQRREAWNALSEQEQEPFHEAIARNFEIYLGDGVAPTRRQKRLFQRIRVFMTQVYENIAMRVNDIYRKLYGRELFKINAKVRRAFDSMVAAKDDIELELQRTEKPDMEMPDDMRQAMGDRDDEVDIDDLREEAKQTAIDELTRELLNDAEVLDQITGRATSAVRSDARRVRREIKKSIESVLMRERVHRLREFLRTGKLTDENGEVIDTMSEDVNTRLNSDQVRKLIPGIRLNDLGGAMTSPEGMDLNTVADLFAYDSATEMVSELRDSLTFREDVEAQTQQQMLAEYGNLATPEAVQETVQRAIYNEAKQVVALRELEAVAGTALPKDVTLQAVRDVARQRIGKMRLRDMRPYQFQNDAMRARREAFRQLRLGNRFKAAQAFRSELLYNAMVRESALQRRNADERIRRIERDFARGKDAQQAKTRDMRFIYFGRVMLNKMGMGTQPTANEQQLGLIAEYDPEFFQANLNLITALDNMAVDNPLDLTGDKLREGLDMVEAVWDRSRTVRQIEVAGKRMDRDELARSMARQLQDLGKVDKDLFEGLLDSKTVKAWSFAQMSAMMKRLEQSMMVLDGGAEGGLFASTFYESLREALDKNDVELRKYYVSLQEMMKRINALEQQAPHEIAAPELRMPNGQPYVFGKSRRGDNGAIHEIVTMIANLGNASNSDRLMSGYGWSQRGEDGRFDIAPAIKFINRLLKEGVITRDVVDLAQGMMDVFESIKPDFQKALFEVEGRMVPEIQARPFTLQIDGQPETFAGGYVPMRYDPDIGKMSAEAQATIRATARSLNLASSATKERAVQNVDKVNLRLDTLMGTFAEHTRYAYVVPAVKRIKDLLNASNVAPEFDSVDRVSLGEAIRRMNPGLYGGSDNSVLDLAMFRASSGSLNPATVMPNAFNRVIGALRRNMGSIIFTFHLRNAGENPLALIGALTSSFGVQAKYVAAAWNARKQDVEYIMSVSPMMNGRMQANAQQIVAEDFTPANFQKKLSSRLSYLAPRFTQQILEATLWKAAHDQWLAEQRPDGMSDADAIQAARRFADRKVRLNLGSGDLLDAPAYEGAFGDAARILTQFTGWFAYKNSMAQLSWERFKQDAGLGAYGRFAWNIVSLFYLEFMISAAMRRWLMGEAEEEDDEAFEAYLIQSMILEPMRMALAGAVPIAGDMVGGGLERLVAVAARAIDEDFPIELGRGVESPRTGAFDWMARNANKSLDLLRGEFKGSELRALVETFAAILGKDVVMIPAMAGRQIQYGADLLTGSAEPQDAEDVVRGFIQGR